MAERIARAKATAAKQEFAALCREDTQRHLLEAEANRFSAEADFYRVKLAVALATRDTTPDLEQEAEEHQVPLLSSPNNHQCVNFVAIVG